MDISKRIAALNDELIHLRRDFHEHPELGLREFRTAQIVEDYLKELGLSVRRCAGTGVIGVLRGGLPGKTVMLRADMDALPIQEQTCLPFSSKNPGVMHACGHDGHTAMLLITAKILSENSSSIRGSVVFLFQLNEEDAGAELMIRDGALESPKPDAVFGFHLKSSIPTGKISVMSGPMMPSSYYFKLVITGKGGHGGYPHLAINPINTASHVLSAIDSYLSCEVEPRQPTTITVCKIHGGTKEIVIPDTVELEGSIRCLHTEDAVVRNRLRELIEQVCGSYRCTCSIEFKCGNTMLSNDIELTQMIREISLQQFGSNSLVTCSVSGMGGDDFAEFSNIVPGVYYLIGCANAKKKTDIPNHHPCFDIDEDALKYGVEMNVGLTLRYLNVEL